MANDNKWHLLNYAYKILKGKGKEAVDHHYMYDDIKQLIRLDYFTNKMKRKQTQIYIVFK